jgi:hypothetical protein
VLQFRRERSNEVETGRAEECDLLKPVLRLAVATTPPTTTTPPAPPPTRLILCSNSAVIASRSNTATR